MSTIITRAGKGSALSWAEADANFTNLNTDKAETASPTFTGTPLAPTAAVGTNTTQVATTAYTKAEIASDRPYSDTNPSMNGSVTQGISPKVSRQDHVHPSDTTKANLASPTFTGIVTTPQEVIGVSATASENHFFDGSTANTLSIKRGTPASPGSEIIKVLSGVLSFPNQGQSLATNGYVKLPGGLIVQWGYSSSVATDFSVAFPITFPTATLSIQATMVANATTIQVFNAIVDAISTSSFSIRKRYQSGATTSAATEPFYWFAVGY